MPASMAQPPSSTAARAKKKLWIKDEIARRTRAPAESKKSLVRTFAGEACVLDGSPGLTRHHDRRSDVDAIVEVGNVLVQHSDTAVRGGGAD